MHDRSRASIGATFAVAALIVSLNVDAQTPSSAVVGNGVSQTSTAILKHVTDAREKTLIVHDILKSIRGLNPAARLIKCDDVVRYWDTSVAGKDSSFAAICTFDFGGRHGHSDTEAVCDDWMIGKFTLGGANGSNDLGSDSKLIDYIRLNCPPGG